MLCMDYIIPTKLPLTKKLGAKARNSTFSIISNKTPTYNRLFVYNIRTLFLNRVMVETMAISKANKRTFWSTRRPSGKLRRGCMISQCYLYFKRHPRSPTNQITSIIPISEEGLIVRGEKL